MKYKHVVLSTSYGTLNVVASQDKVSYGIGDKLLLDAEIFTHPDKIVIIGSLVVLGLAIGKEYVNEMDVRPCEEDIKRTLFTKREYVEGLYDTNKRRDFQIASNNYIIEYR